MSKRLLQEISFFLILFLGFSAFAYLFLNGGAYWRIFRYAIFLESPFAEEDLKQGEILTVSAAAPVALEEQEVEEREPLYRLGEGGYVLVIPKISITVPIIIPRDASKQGILASLEEGVGLYPGSSEPGEAGRIVMLGHSSRASWYRGEYATVFSLLSELEVFDVFYVTGGNKKYTYQIFKNQVLSPSDANILLASAVEDSEVDLVTCYPVGTSSKRTVIRAKLIKTEDI